jgi:succinate dehydrogenase/fumarate reductase cytochrome b subunit
MKPFYKLLAIFGISWAVLIHPFLFFRDVKDEHYRIVSGMAGVSQDLFVKAHATNGVFIVPENYGDAYATRTQQLLASEDRRSVIFSAVTWISSAFIVVLSVCILKRCKKDERPAV